MGYSSEVKAVLGLDTSKMPADAAKAVDAFKKAAQQMENEAEKHGAGAGEKLIHSLEHKLLGARHLSGALATALGLNLEKISEKIAGAIVGGTSEGWKEALAISEQNARLVSNIIEARLSPKQLEEHHQRELDKAIRESTDEGGGHGEAVANALTAGLTANVGGAGSGFIKSLLGIFGLGKTEAEKLKETEEKTHEVLEAQSKVEEDHRATKREILALEDQTLTSKEKQGTLLQRNDAVLDHIQKLEEEVAKGGLTEVEVAKKKLEIEDKFTEIQGIEREMRAKALEDEKRQNELAAKRVELEQQRINLKKDEAKLTDRSKLTVGELAQLAENKKSGIAQAAAEDEAARSNAFQFGRDADLSSGQIAARDKAEEIQRLQRKEERARLSGDQAGSAGLLSQIGTLRDSLVESGFTKTTEGDPAKLLLEQVTKDFETIKKTLASIETTEKGKYVNQ